MFLEANLRGRPSVAVVKGSDQSINQSKVLTSHTLAKEKPHPSTTTRGANPASRSNAGLGGCERVATAPRANPDYNYITCMYVCICMYVNMGLSVCGAYVRTCVSSATYALRTDLYRQAV